MSVVEINVVDPEALQRLLTSLHDIFRRAVDVPHSRSNAELGREEYFGTTTGIRKPFPESDFCCGDISMLGLSGNHEVVLVPYTSAVSQNVNPLFAA